MNNPLLTVLILTPYPLAQAPSQRFRLEQFLPFFESQQVKYELHTFLDATTGKILYQPGNTTQKILGIVKGFLYRMLLLWQVSKFDYIFIHREVSPIGPPIFEFVLAKIFRKKIIYDFDDAIWLPNTTKENNLATFLKWNQKVKTICKWSWKVSVGNDYLADFARQHNKQVVVIPTVVDTTNHHYPRETDNNSKVVVGWTGSHSTLKYLEELIEVFKEVEKQIEIQFLVIANRNPDLPLKNYQFLYWNKETEIEDLSQIDIGIMPLPDNQWTHGKCGFKAIQYMALGIPALVSPVAVNTKIVDDKVNGFHCKTEEEWKSRLVQLIDNKSLRKKMGDAARKKIIENYSVNAIQKDFFTLFEEEV